MQFANGLGYYAFLGLVALVIIYLIRPRAKELTIPSLMFVMKDAKKAKRSSFLQRLLRSLLFLMQALIIAALALSIMMPSMIMKIDSSSRNTVVVMDISASMQTGDRFDTAIETAKGSLQGKSSIILAGETPAIALESKSASKAKSILSTLKAKDVETNLGDAMLLAKDILADQDGRVIVLSDFIYTMGPDPLVVKKILEASDIVVDFVDVKKRSEDNVGVVDLIIDKFKTKVYIKNYGDKEKTVTLEIRSNTTRTFPKTILADSIETIEFDTHGGVTEIKIIDKDDFAVDNKAYVSAPEKTSIDVLMIANRHNEYLKFALESSKEINLVIAEPPIVPDIKHDIVIIGDIDAEKLLPGTMEDIKSNVGKGMGLIILGQKLLSSIDFKDLLPVTAVNVSGRTPIHTEVINRFTKDADFGSVTESLVTSAFNSSLVIARSDFGDMIVLAEYRKGSILYYGIYDDKSDFKSSPGYPIFWNELINFLMGTEDIENFNLDTGKLLLLDERTRINTPTGNVRTQNIILDKIGVYTIGDRKIAVNLLSEKESDIDKDASITTERHDSYAVDKIEREQEVSLENYLLVFILIMLFIELFYVKFRGDI